MDVVMFLNNHRSFLDLDVFDMVRRMNKNPIVFDGWSLFRGEDVISAAPAMYLGLSHTESSVIV